MGRTILAESSLETYVNSLVEAGSWNIGLIIGQQSSVIQYQKDCAVRLARTPEGVEDQADVESDRSVRGVEWRGDRSDEERKKDGSVGEGREHEQIPRSITPRSGSLEKIDVMLVATHAKQVTKMLPGGLNVIGVFAVAPSKVLQESQVKLRQVMFAVHKILCKGQILRKNGRPISDRVLLQLCTDTKKLTCKTLDVGDHKSTFRPADWKYQPVLDKFIRLESRISLDFGASLTDEMTTFKLFKQMQTTSMCYCRRVLSAMATINGRMRKLDELLDTTVVEKKGKSKKEIKDENPTQQVYNVDLFLSATEKNNNIEFPTLTECAAKMHVHGALTCRAYVHGKATVKEAINAMKVDVVRSLLSRLELLCEDINVTAEDREEIHVENYYDTPRRVFAEIPGHRITYCDYAFREESVQEIRDRYTELLDMEVPQGCLTMDAEYQLENGERADYLKSIAYDNGSGDQKESETVSLPVQIKGSLSNLYSLYRSSTTTTTAVPSRRKLRLMGTMAVGVVAIVSVVISYVMSLQGKADAYTYAYDC